MYRTQTETKLVWWPTPQDYNEAIQVPLACLGDPELKAGLPYTNALELPRSITGSFASVYRMHCKNKDFALRLFLNNIRDQHERYALISDFVQHDDLPYTVTFDFLDQGIKIHGEWLPALKMDWLEGEQLDDYIVDNLANPNKLGHLLEKFVKMMQEMRRAGIAHGDLQHGNILVCKDELRLVDYDGMFVPAMKGFSASELGHRNYQHPDRAAHHFGPYLDNFSAWIIYASLYALQIDSRLMHQLGGGDDCLLFRQSDFLDPIHSSAFAALEKHSDTRLRDLGRFVRVQLKTELQNIPYLTLPLPQGLDKDLHPLSASASTVKSGARLVRGNLPDWLQEKNAEVLSNPKLGHLDSGAAASQSWTVPAKPTQQAAWFKPGVAAANACKAHGASKLNKIASSINAAAQQKQQQLSAAQQRMLHPSAPKTPFKQPPLPQLPVELTGNKTPRAVKWNPNCGRINPRDTLCLMLLNPLVWLMFSFSSHAMGIDAQLAAKGIMVPATVTNVEVHPGSSARSRIDYEYKYNNRSYFGSEERSPGAKVFEAGGGYTIGILPDNPFVTEALNKPLGTKRHGDEMFALIFLLANLSLVAAILWAPLKQRKLIASGIPLIANIDLLRMHTGVTNTIDTTPGEMWFKADISFVLNGTDMYRSVSVTESEYHSLKGSSTEVILCDPSTNEVTFYRFARYHAVEPSTAIKTVKP
ncbi:MAG: hypothetical protein JST89_09220 [Cyanobacteria bacterium SZAS-4]|nr:hypothetical protein [Cyanobacteria bacterium SZAS-4]